MTQWAAQQIAALLELGFALADAQASVKWVLSTMPQGANPDTWMPTAIDLDANIDAAAIQDARVAWYSDDAVPGRYKRMLDARTPTNG